MSLGLANSAYSQGGLGRTPIQQGGYQIAALAITLGMATISGVITGFIMKIPIFEQVHEEADMLDDGPNWIMVVDSKGESLSIESGEGGQTITKHDLRN